ncbi:hypothetical protein V6N13_029861 [Hibiscus sabdariffa]
MERFEIQDDVENDGYGGLTSQHIVTELMARWKFRFLPTMVQARDHFGDEVLGLSLEHRTTEDLWKARGEALHVIDHSFSGLVRHFWGLTFFFIASLKVPILLNASPIRIPLPSLAFSAFCSS